MKSKITNALGKYYWYIFLVSFFLIIGFLIDESMHIKMNENNHTLDTAITTKLFGTRLKDLVNSSKNDIFIYAELNASNPTSFKELNNDYIYIKRIRQRYVRKVKEVDFVWNKTYIAENEYYEWENISTKVKKSDKIIINGVDFDFKQLDSKLIKKVKTTRINSKERYVYYGIKENQVGTIRVFKNNKHNVISFYPNKDVKTIIKELRINYNGRAFWGMYLGTLVILSIAIVPFAKSFLEESGEYRY